MFKRKRQDENELLDRLGTEVVRAAELDAGAPGAGTPSPYLYNRIRSAIESAQGAERHKPVSSPLGVLAAGRLNIALAGLSLLVAGWFWLIRIRPQAPGPGVFPAAGSIGRLSADRLTACSISSKDKCVISTEDVLQLLVSQKLQEQGK